MMTAYQSIHQKFKKSGHYKVRKLPLSLQLPCQNIAHQVQGFRLTVQPALSTKETVLTCLQHWWLRHSAGRCSPTSEHGLPGSFLSAWCSVRLWDKNKDCVALVFQFNTGLPLKTLVICWGPYCLLSFYAAIENVMFISPKYRMVGLWHLEELPHIPLTLSPPFPWKNTNLNTDSPIWYNICYE